jgi:hypothetical protein
MTRVLLAAVVLMAASVWVFGQATGAISGKVVDDKGEAVPGALITVSGKALQGTRGGATNVDGEFTIPQLPPGAGYEIVVEAAGFNKVQRSGITVSLGGNITMTIALNPGGQTITVTGQAPVIDLKETKVDTNISLEELNILPIPRRFQDALYLAPSVVDSGMGRGNPSVAGSTGTENVFVINGMNTTDPVTGTFGSNLNFNFIQDMEISSGGYTAEYGASTGGLFNVITKSGSNEFHGEGFLYYSNQNFNAKSLEVPSGPVMSSSYTWDYGLDLGGPIIKDKLWYFVGLNPMVKLDTYNGSKAGYDYATNTWAVFPYDYKEKRKNYYWSVKFNYRINDKHNLELSVFSDPSRFDNSDSMYGVYASAYESALPSYRDQDGVNVALRWYSSWSPTFFTETSYGRGNHILNVLPVGTEASSSPQIVNIDWGMVGDTSLPGEPAGDIYGYIMTPGFGWYSYDRRMRDEFAFKATKTFHKHELVAGVDWEGLEWLNTTDVTGGKYEYVWDEILSYTHDPFTTDPANFNSHDRYWYQNPHTDERSEYEAAYIQDHWSLTDYLAFNVGVREERERFSPQNGEKLKVTSTSPRLGFTWDVAHNSKSKIYASYGYFTERVPMGFATALDNGHALYEAYWTGGGVDPPAMGAQYFTYGATGDIVQPGVEAPYKKELIVGAQYEIAPDWALGVRAVYRTLGRVFEDVEYPLGTGTNITSAYILMNPGEYWPTDIMSNWNSSTNHDDPNYDYTGYDDYMKNGFPKPKQFYKALQITLNKRFSNNWFLNVYYTLSRLEGDTSGGGYDSILNPGMGHTSPDYDIPSWYLYRNKYGLLSTDHTHVLQAQGGVKLSNGIVLGANFQLQSGTPLSKWCDVPVSMSRNEYYLTYGTIFLTPRGSEGRTPYTWTLDVHAEYTLKLKKSSLGFFVDAFNVTNNQKATAKNQQYYRTGDNTIFDGTVWFTSNDLSDMSAFDSKVAANPASNNPHYGEVTARQTPRTARVGIKWTF